MGRDVRRVPMDFDWPMKETWQGYLLPAELHEDTCPDCENGMTADGELITGIAYMITGLADDVSDQARGRAMHPYLQPIQDVSYVHGRPRPTPRFEEFIKGLFPEDDGPGFGGRQPYRMARRLIELAGLDYEWAYCLTCKGHGSVERYEGQRAEAEAWEHVEPPEGEGWQMWETTSEGSPMSPVFATPDELATWLADTGASMFGSTTATKDRWLSIITGDDFAHVVIAPGVVVM